MRWEGWSTSEGRLWSSSVTSRLLDEVCSVPVGDLLDHLPSALTSLFPVNCPSFHLNHLLFGHTEGFALTTTHHVRDLSVKHPALKPPHICVMLLASPHPCSNCFDPTGPSSSLTLLLFVLCSLFTQLGFHGLIRFILFKYNRRGLVPHLLCVSRPRVCVSYPPTLSAPRLLSMA